MGRENESFAQPQAQESSASSDELEIQDEQVLKDVKCPICSGEVYRAKIPENDTSVLHCPKCRAVWTNKKYLNRMKRLRKYDILEVGLKGKLPIDGKTKECEIIGRVGYVSSEEDKLWYEWLLITEDGEYVWLTQEGEEMDNFGLYKEYIPNEFQIEEDQSIIINGEYYNKSEWSYTTKTVFIEGESYYLPMPNEEFLSYDICEEAYLYDEEEDECKGDTYEVRIGEEEVEIGYNEAIPWEKIVLAFSLFRKVYGFDKLETRRSLLKEADFIKGRMRLIDSEGDLEELWFIKGKNGSIFWVLDTAPEVKYSLSEYYVIIDKPMLEYTILKEEEYTSNRYIVVDVEGEMPISANPGDKLVFKEDLNSIGETNLIEIYKKVGENVPAVVREALLSKVRTETENFTGLGILISIVMLLASILGGGSSLPVIDIIFWIGALIFFIKF